MPYGLYIAAEGAHAQSKRMEVLSNNLANVDTPGFKRDLAQFQARYAEETARGQDHPGSGSINDVGGGVWMNGVITDHTPGTLKRTEIQTDMAINGEGYFVVQKDGQNYLTRAGNFMVNSNGLLVTQTGMPVLSDGGAPVPINAGTPWKVSSDGAIEQDGGKTYLALVRPPSPAELKKHGENLFQPLAATTPVPTELRSVQEGYLEMSGVRPTLEMLELIETSRAFEMNVSMIRNHDAMLNSLVNRVLRQS
ncbi:MAG: flagellar basal-body rod protein FlgF [Pirellulales bacterium]